MLVESKQSATFQSCRKLRLFTSEVRKFEFISYCRINLCNLIISTLVADKLKFTVTPAAKTLELGTVRRILCKAQGSPAPIVRWVKEGGPLLKWPPHIEDVNGTLFFHGVQDEDAGQYTCIATNSQGLISASIFINVTSK